MQDKKADMKISSYVDLVMEKVVKRLGVEIPAYQAADDPTKSIPYSVRWNIPDSVVKTMDKLYDKMVKEKGKLKRMQNDDKSEVRKNAKKLKSEKPTQEDNKESIQ